MSKIFNIAIYGAGGCGRSLFKSIQRNFEFNIKNFEKNYFFIDDDKKIKFVNKIKVLDFVKLGQLENSSKIFICVSNSKIDLKF